jgi:RNA polymerase sigma-70 factor (sigma-E family)
VDRAAETDFEGFVARSGRSLLRTAWLLTGDRGHAEDIVQTALERTASRWGRLEGVPEAYARRAVINLAKDRWRRRRTRVVEVPVAELRSRAEPTARLDSDAADLRERLLADLRRLPPRQRAVLVLRYFEDLDERETAQILGVSVGTVKSSASRGLARLRLNAGESDSSPTAVPPGGQR